MNVTEHRNALPVGCELQEYRIEGMLGHGNFGITYLAMDIHLDKRVVIKEYLPQELAIREQDSTVVAKSSDDQDSYQWGLQRFLSEARVLAQFNHPNIVRVLRFLEAHNTAYFVMEYEEGENLADYLKHQEPVLSEQQIMDVFIPILDGLRMVHSKGLLHRDIKPDNIFLRNDSSPMLIDFGAAREAMGERGQPLTTVYTAGYAPYEQQATGKQGPWTDIYGVGASMYQCMTGEMVVGAALRNTAFMEQEPDPYVPVGKAVMAEYSDTLITAVDAALAFRIKDRPQTVKAFQNMLMTDMAKAKSERWWEGLLRWMKHWFDFVKQHGLTLFTKVKQTFQWLSVCRTGWASGKKSFALIGACLFVAAAAGYWWRTEPNRLIARECELAAGSPYQEDIAGFGVELNKIDPWYAIDLCSQALEVYPNNPKYQYLLGRAYHAKNDLSQALLYYGMAAGQGLVIAQFEQGLIYLAGTGNVTQDNKKALEWFRLAADQGLAIAQNELGRMYRKGQGVEQDDQASIAWYLKAAAKNNWFAQYNLGNIYELGIGVDANGQKAVE